LLQGRKNLLEVTRGSGGQEEGSVWGVNDRGESQGTSSRKMAKHMGINPIDMTRKKQKNKKKKKKNTQKKRAQYRFADQGR